MLSIFQCHSKSAAENPNRQTTDIYNSGTSLDHSTLVYNHYGNVNRLSKSATQLQNSSQNSRIGQGSSTLPENDSDGMSTLRRAIESRGISETVTDII